jgi:hypothetical protein
MNKILICFGIICILLITLFATSISANIISLSNDPGDELDQYQEQYDVSVIFGGVSGFSKAQSFKPTYNILTRAEINTRTSAYSGYPTKITFTIRKDLLGNNLVAPITMSFKEKWFEFDFNDLQVTPEDTYYLVFDEIGGNIGWECTDNEYLYDRGEAKSKYSENKWRTPGYDFCFRTYGRDGNDGNNPPEIPVLVSAPDQGIIDNEQTFQFKSLDIDQDQVKVRVDWGDGTEPTESELFDSNEVISVSHVWDEPNVYWMTITAIDEHGSESFYSLESDPVYIRSYQNNPPMKPELWGDSEGEFNKDLEFSATTWDCDKNNIYYFFDFGDGTDSSWVGPYQSGETCTVTKSWKGFLFTEYYEISVVAKDQSGAKSQWSDSMEVKVYQGRSRELVNLFPKLTKVLSRFLSL